MKETKYKEIFKLKEMLEKESIPFQFVDTTYKDFESYQIVYPSFNNIVCSIIEGFGTYGALWDMLEIDGLLTEREMRIDTITGFLEAEEVFERIKKHYEQTNQEGEDNGL